MEEYREESLPSVYTFLREQVVSDSTAWVYTTDLYTSYTQWAEQEGYPNTSIAPRSVGRWVKKVYPTARPERIFGKGRGFKGIGLEEE